ncbi:MAG: nitroreductase family protein [Myxococcota bacterium]
MPPHPTVALAPHSPDLAPPAAAQRFFEIANRRRSVREFSDRPVDRATIEAIVRAAGTAPSGAHKQPWRFVCVSDPAVKRAIREAAEAEERLFYETRAPAEWLHDLEPFGTDSDKGFLEVAPWLIVAFRLAKGDDGGAVYYGVESVGLACGILLTAIHQAGLVALTHTPSPMGFLRRVLGRPAHERPFLLIPVGHPAAECRVPDLARKPLESIATFIE